MRESWRYCTSKLKTANDFRIKKISAPGQENKVAKFPNLGYFHSMGSRSQVFAGGREAWYCRPKNINFS